MANLFEQLATKLGLIKTQPQSTTGGLFKTVGDGLKSQTANSTMAVSPEGSVDTLSSAIKLAIGIPQQVARGGFSLGQTVIGSIANAIEGKSVPSYQPSQALSVLLGKEPVLDIPSRISKGTATVEQTTGLPRGVALPLAAAGTLASTVLDFSGLGGEKNALRALVNASKIDDGFKIGRQIHIAEDLLDDFSRAAVAVKTEKEAKILFDNFAKIQKETKSIVPKTSSLFTPTEDIKPLLSEARKYKTAEEFVGGQKSIYHGTTKTFEKFDPELSPGGSAWFTDSRKALETGQDVGLNRKAGETVKIIDRYIKPGLKLVDRGTAEGRKLADDLMTGQLESQGYRGVIHEADAKRGRYVELFYPNEDALTKSQLADIWKEANKGIVREDNVGDPVENLTTILNKYKPLRGKQEALYTAERGQRIPKVEQSFQKVGGEAGFRAGLGKLKGELPKVELSKTLESDIRNTIKQGGVDELFTRIQNTKWMNTWEKVTTQTGLSKALSGQIPTEGELRALETIFGPKFAESLKVAQPWKFSLWNTANEIGGTMKVLLSSLGDLSAFGRQLWFYVTRHPVKGVKLLKEGGKAAVNPGYYDAIENAIRTHEYYPLARRFNLPLTEVGGATTKLSNADEQFLIKWIKDVPGIGTTVKATERAFNAMANKARADWFYSLTDDLIKAGYDPIKNPEAFQKASTFIADFTGRANLGKVLNESSELLNFFAYSPRLIVSRVKILTSPITYLKAPAPIRKEAFKTLFSYAGTVMSVLYAAHLAGADIETDVRSTDFAKIKWGKSRIDITGGLQPYIRFLAQIITGQAKVKGKTVDRPRGDTLLTFLRGKGSPLVSLGWDIFSGKTYLGDKTTVGGASWDHFVNLMAQDITSAAQESGTFEAVAAGLSNFLGVGFQTYENKPKEASGLPSLKLPTIKLPKLP